MAGHGHIDGAFDYKLCVFPPAIAESPDLLHEPQKASFADAIWANIPNKDVEIPKPAQYVIDGGALLYPKPWTRGETFDHILKSYTGYVHNRYGKAVVVFDGYCSASTKDLAHRRRAKGKLGPTV